MATIRRSALLRSLPFLFALFLALFTAAGHGAGESSHHSAHAVHAIGDTAHPARTTGVIADPAAGPAHDAHLSAGTDSVTPPAGDTSYVDAEFVRRTAEGSAAHRVPARTGLPATRHAAGILTPRAPPAAVLS
ncbi:hypothetical protein KZ829_00835 [Actinoplanes hulinensis]|uniref:Secreted protein n=1 Tax=Actinoplanes hulinensis TaxID=1144547 RepID=A0ABS7AW32_9ACTN|nr:hypothetical protein [Actinoplanes hulinensis]MBW6432293.1 hypothetical protein [Actinoplanes hulinensis]